MGVGKSGCRDSEVEGSRVGIRREVRSGETWGNGKCINPSHPRGTYLCFHSSSCQRSRCSFGDIFFVDGLGFLSIFCFFISFRRFFHLYKKRKTREKVNQSATIVSRGYESYCDCLKSAG